MTPRLSRAVRGYASSPPNAFLVLLDTRLCVCHLLMSPVQLYLTCRRSWSSLLAVANEGRGSR